MRTKKTLRLEDLNVFLTDEQIAENKRKIDLRLMLGIYYNIDSNSKHQDELLGITNEQFIKISTQYKSLSAYNEDKRTADMLIIKDREIPIDLANKLIQTKRELEAAGIL